MSRGYPPAPVIRQLRIVADPPPPASDHKEFFSPDRSWSVVYHTPNERHMGADGWQVQLLHNGRDVTREHTAMARLGGSAGFKCEAGLRPWSHDGRTMVLLTWGADSVHLYHVPEKSLQLVPLGWSLVRSAQWSASADRLLVISDTQAVLVDHAGQPHGAAAWRNAEFESPFADWTADGRWFFVLARESVAARPVLTFCFGEDGTPVAAVELDPAEIIPYDARPFDRLPRDAYCLVLNTSTRSVGRLLDTWSSVRFDPEASTLYLAVYRPTSAVYTDGGESLCTVEERWV